MFHIFLLPHSECAPGLVCFQRSADEPVPGCFGLAVTDRDYCYDPNYVGTVPAPTMGAFVPAPAPTFPAPTFPAPTFPAPTLPAVGNLDVIGDCDGDDNDFCGLCIGDCDEDGDVSSIYILYGIECALLWLLISTTLLMFLMFYFLNCIYVRIIVRGRTLLLPA